MNYRRSGKGRNGPLGDLLSDRKGGLKRRINEQRRWPRGRREKEKWGERGMDELASRKR